MLEFRRIQVEDKEIARCTCNKCGQVWEYNDPKRPDITTIKNTYGYGSHKDGDKYVSHICEPCMDAFYATFAVKPQVAGMVVWGEETSDPVRYLPAPEVERLMHAIVKELETPPEPDSSGFSYVNNLREQLHFYLGACTPDEREALAKISATLPGDPITVAPVAPAVEEHESQEEASQEP